MQLPMPSRCHDLVVEHQRGLTILGYPAFTPNLLIHGLDPPQFQILIANGKTVDANEIVAGAGMYPLDLNDNIKDYKWFVSMDHGGQYETDDQGWSYGWRFGSHHWKSKNGFVRKRFWTRMPAKPEQLYIEDTVDNDQFPQDSSASECGEVSATEMMSPEDALIKDLERPLVDRQRLEKIQEFLRPLSVEDMKKLCTSDSPFLNKVLKTLLFEMSKKKLLDVVLPELLIQKEKSRPL